MREGQIAKTARDFTLEAVVLRKIRLATLRLLGHEPPPTQRATHGYLTTALGIPPSL